jgi:hypothetical protein
LLVALKRIYAIEEDRAAVSRLNGAQQFGFEGARIEGSTIKLNE